MSLCLSLPLISTHSAREDGDYTGRTKIVTGLEFQPTPPARTETNDAVDKLNDYIFSTHSAREDGDQPQKLFCYVYQYFNPLRPRGRRHYWPNIATLLTFQPTPPARTETSVPLYNKVPFIYFNPLRPRGRRPHADKYSKAFSVFQPTAREDGDTEPLDINGKKPISTTPPARTET